MKMQKNSKSDFLKTPTTCQCKSNLYSNWIRFAFENIGQREPLSFSEFLKIDSRRCTQKWSVSGERAFVLSPNSNKNRPVKLNSAHHGNTSIWIFPNVCREFNLWMHHLALQAVIKILATKALSRGFRSPIQVFKFSPELKGSSESVYQ